MTVLLPAIEFIVKARLNRPLRPPVRVTCVDTPPNVPVAYESSESSLDMRRAARSSGAIELDSWDRGDGLVGLLDEGGTCCELSAVVGGEGRRAVLFGGGRTVVPCRAALLTFPGILSDPGRERSDDDLVVVLLFVLGLIECAACCGGVPPLRAEFVESREVEESLVVTYGNGVGWYEKLSC